MGAFDLASYLWPEVDQCRQPQGPVGVASEWADACLAAYPVLGLGRESADGGKAFAGIANPSQYASVIGRAGQGFSGDGAANAVAKGLYTQAGAVPYHGLAAFSCFAVFELTAITSGLESAIFRATGTNVSQGVALGVFPSTKKIRALIQTNGTTGWSASYDVTDSRIAAGMLWGIGVSYVSGRRVIYSGPIGGAMVATVTTAITGTITDSAATSGPVYFGGSWYTGGTTPSLPGKIYSAAFWRVSKTRAEFEALFANPWQIYEVQTLPFSLPVSSGTDLHASAAGSSNSAGAAEISAQVALAGIGVSTSGGVANAGASIPLSAAGLSVSGGSANAKATVTISAAGLAQSAGQAGLSASVLMQAAGAAQSAGNAVLAAQLAAMASGASQSSGSANLSGGAPGSLSATGGSVSSGAAVLSVTVQLAATGQSVSSGTANLAGGAPGQISASGSSQSGGAAMIAVTVQLTAAGFSQAMGAGQLQVQVDLAAQGVSASSGSARLVDLGVAVIAAARRQPTNANFSRRSNVQTSSRPPAISRGSRSCR